MPDGASPPVGIRRQFRCAKEAYRRTGDNTASVAEGLARTAGVITGAALIMVTVFAAFALAEVITIKSIGVGMVIAAPLTRRSSGFSWCRPRCA